MSNFVNWWLPVTPFGAADTILSRQAFHYTILIILYTVLSNMCYFNCDLNYVWNALTTIIAPQIDPFRKFSVTIPGSPPGPWFNKKMSSYQYRKSHCGDKTILRPSYLHNGISDTGKMASLYWIRALEPPTDYCDVIAYAAHGKLPLRSKPSSCCGFWADTP